MNKQVSIFCQESLHQWLLDSNLFFTHKDGEFEVIVDDVEYTVHNGIYQDPDEQLCEHYGIDYNQVNRIEALNFCAI